MGIFKSTLVYATTFFGITPLIGAPVSAIWMTPNELVTPMSISPETIACDIALVLA